MCKFRVFVNLKIFLFLLHFIRFIYGQECVCVKENLCDDGNYNYIQEKFLIDIRVGAQKQCENKNEVCCENLKPKGILKTSTFTNRFCGIRNVNGVDPLVKSNKINESKLGEFPWVVAILKRNDSSLIAGGSLIAPNIILTAAHSIEPYGSVDIKIRAGEWDTQNKQERWPYQERDVLSKIAHKDFNPNNLHNDIAILILHEPVQFAENVGTICLPKQSQLITSKNCFSSGWGKNKFGRSGLPQAILKKLELPIIDSNECQDNLRTTRLGQFFLLHQSFICVKGKNGSDMCTGDGGSPLVCPESVNSNRYILAGIVSWGIGCGEEGTPGVNVRVANFRQWIEEQFRILNLDMQYFTT